MSKSVFYILLAAGVVLIVVGMWLVAGSGSNLLGWGAVVVGLLTLGAPAVSWRSTDPDKVDP
ncbi:hypothetical protein [Kocuria sp.]|uniref:hypothetical protein n=1 Tax=Kocuria sp. TaxID=1871328 RepID=UPI0026E0DFC5|nr:hypothetical protein [Kocuria sp.]MDO5617715.1 hypothetical protein [Kocuria sp.]